MSGASVSQLRMEVAQEDHDLRTLLFGGGLKTTDGVVHGEDSRLKVASVLNSMMNERLDLVGEISVLRANVAEQTQRTDQAHEEIARLREFGEHYSGAAQDAWDRIGVLEKALREIAEEQQKTLGWIRAHGIVFDGPLGTDPSNWENVAFSIYADLCEVDTIARAALAVASPGGDET